MHYCTANELYSDKKFTNYHSSCQSQNLKKWLFGKATKVIILHTCH